MKNGDFRLAVKAAHTEDLNSGVMLSARVHHGDLSDTQTHGDMITDVEIRFKRSDVAAGISAVAADKRYHNLVQLAALQTSLLPNCAPLLSGITC